MGNFTQKIIVALDIKTDSFKTGVRGIKSDVAEAEGSFGKLKAAAGGIGNAIGGAFTSPAGIAGIATAATSVAVKAVGAFEDLGLTVGKFRDITGATAEDSSKLVEVFDDMGIGAEKGGAAIAKMNKQLGANADAFKEFGIEAVRAADGTIDTVATFENAVDVISKMPDKTKQATAANKVFGKSWTDMSEIIEGGSTKLKKSLDSVQGSKILTDADIGKARDLRDGFDAISDAVDGLFLTLGKSLAPSVAKIATSLGDMASKAEPAMEQLGESLAAVGDALVGVVEGLGETVDFLHTIGADTGALAVFDKLGISLSDLSLGAIPAFTKAWDAAFGDVKVKAAIDPSVKKAVDIVDDHAKAIEEDAKKTAAAIKSLDKWVDAVLKQQTAVANATNEIKDMDSAFEQIAGRKDALSKVFQIDEGPRDARSKIRDIAGAIGGLSEAAKGVKIGEVLANNVKADEFLDAIDQLAPQIQEAVTNVFGDSGPEAAIAMANSYIDQVTKELGGKFSREQVAAMLGLDNITATIQAAVDADSLATAQHKLELLVGLTGVNPWTATIELAMDAGLITPDAAQALIDAQLRGQGVKVPLNPEISDAEMAEARAFAQANHIEWPIDLTIGASGGAGGKRQSLISDAGLDDELSLDVKVTANTDVAEKTVDAFVATTARRNDLKLTLLADPQPAAAIVNAFVAAAKLRADIVVPVQANTQRAQATVDQFAAVNKTRGDVNVPVGANTGPATAAVNNVVAATNRREATVPVDANTNQFDRDVNQARTAASRPLVIPVVFKPQGTPQGATGGTAGPRGMIAGEAGAELVQFPWMRGAVLLTSPTFVPPGTKVTSVRRTRQILSGAVPSFSPPTMPDGTNLNGARVAGGVTFIYQQQAPIYGVEDLDRHLRAWSQQIASKIAVGRR